MRELKEHYPLLVTQISHRPASGIASADYEVTLFNPYLAGKSTKIVLHESELTYELGEMYMVNIELTPVPADEVAVMD